ncbi:MAG: UpxY family transcription antiterminator [Sediminibacterium sp.]|nr:UpxY family transcription antiterminator [Sediminibacterium sp.]
MNLQNPLNKWIVFKYFKSNFHLKVCDLLQENNFEYYIPLQKQLRKWKDRKKKIDVPILKPYFFVNIEEKMAAEVVRKIPHIRYLTYCNKIQSISTEEIQRIQRICNFEKEHHLEFISSPFNVGSEVLIISGHFKGLKGIVIQDKNVEKIYLNIPSLNRFSKIEIKKEDIQK